MKSRIKREKYNIFKKFPPFLLYAAVIFYLELILRIVTCDDFFNAGLIFMILYSIAAAMFLSGICYFFAQKGRTIAGGAAVVILFALYALQMTYHLFFGKYLIVYSLVSGGVDQVLSGHIISNVIAAFIKGIPNMILLTVFMVNRDPLPPQFQTSGPGWPFGE